MNTKTKADPIISAFAPFPFMLGQAYLRSLTQRAPASRAVTVTAYEVLSQDYISIVTKQMELGAAVMNAFVHAAAIPQAADQLSQEE